jgi:hypothetical protein
MAKKKQTKKMKAAVEKHRIFLKKMGLSEKTVAKNKPSNMPRFLLENIPASYSKDLSNTVQGEITAGSKKGILSDVINYTEADRKIAREMAKSISPEYHKGGLQVLTRNTDLTKLRKV